ncbi:hypothetical protein Glove_120g217 [Diversispora epigaea]|uniref:Crinkler effector protein N-terminal domain-containing protein n=1 Tax=Diversispora epigaea TaxID=1348612 RepID=A0A397J943_9GLOM|nr:hypothetical protein Glove_120g217 [Diversispora epigaea]
MSIKLFCLVKGNSATHAFPVNINRCDTIGDLKEAIREKKPNEFTGVDADKLRLWKVEIPDDRDDLLKALSLKDDNELLATRDIEDYWTDTPPKRHIHVIIEQLVALRNEVSNLREMLENQAFDPIKTRQDDDSLYISTRDMLKKPPEFIPLREGLLTYLQQPPVQPIEIHPTDYDRYFRPEISSEILEKFFVSSLKASRRVWSEFITYIVCPPDAGTTEGSLHALWDMIVVKPLKIGSPQGKHNRNASLHTSTRKLRPDLSFLVSDACLARGEEKGPDTEGNPAEELIEKLTWTYGQCPYIFGYYARATTVTYCYLYLEGEQVLRKDLFTYDLNELSGRIQAFIVGINIGRLLPLLRQTLPHYFQREFVILHRSNGKVVELMQKDVIKRYLLKQSVIYAQAIYDAMFNFNVPFVDQLVRVHVNENETIISFMIFSPKGMICKPQSKTQLIKALYCVLTALKVSVVSILFILETYVFHN